MGCTQAKTRCHLERRSRFASRTPAPPPFSGIISTPAFSRACAIASIVRPCAANSPRRVSSRLMLGRDTPDASAKSFCSHRSSIRAARTCSLVSGKFNTSGIDLLRFGLIPQVSHSRSLKANLMSKPPSRGRAELCPKPTLTIVHTQSVTKTADRHPLKEEV